MKYGYAQREACLIHCVSPSFTGRLPLHQTSHPCNSGVYLRYKVYVGPMLSLGVLVIGSPTAFTSMFYFMYDRIGDTFSIPAAAAAARLSLCFLCHVYFAAHDDTQGLPCTLAMAAIWLRRVPKRRTKRRTL